MTSPRASNSFSALFPSRFSKKEPQSSGPSSQPFNSNGRSRASSSSFAVVGDAFTDDGPSLAQRKSLEPLRSNYLSPESAKNSAPMVDSSLSSTSVLRVQLGGSFRHQPEQYGQGNDQETEDEDTLQTPTEEKRQRNLPAEFLALPELGPTVPVLASASAQATVPASTSAQTLPIASPSLPPPSSPSQPQSYSSAMTKIKTKRGFGGIPKKAKPSQGVSGALVSMSKDLINPANGIVPALVLRSRPDFVASEDEDLVASVPATVTPATNSTSSSSRKRGRKRGLTATSKTSEKSDHTTYSAHPPTASPLPNLSTSNRLSFTSTENGVNRTRANSIYATSDQDMHFYSNSAPESERTDGEDGGGWSEGDLHSNTLLDDGDHSVSLADRTRLGSIGPETLIANGSHNYEDNDNKDDDDKDHHGPSDSDSEESGEAEYDLDDLPVVGFAVASVKRNVDFHALFGKVIPEDDYLIEDYGCALQRDILLQGRLYVSENHLCFHANIFGWVTNLVVPFSETNRIDKKMTAFVIPNAIMITTSDAKHTFASFLSRDTAFDVIHSIWRLSTPVDLMVTNRSFMSTNDDPFQDHTSASLGSDLKAAHQQSPSSPATNNRKKNQSRKQPTTCQCQLNGGHYSETALDTVFPSTPEKLYNLMFTSGFSKDFMSNNQKLMDIQISDWAPQSSGSNLLKRSMSYIKPLPGGFGPKQTKCELIDQTAHVDFDDYVSMITTTRTPEVPSGGSFAVKTRTCLMWAGANSTRVIVTTQVDWTGRSFIKGIIDSSALAGQRSTHGDLDVAMRKYITEHLTEFHTEGVDEEDDLQESVVVTAHPGSNVGNDISGSPIRSDSLSSAGNGSLNHKNQERALLQYSFDLTIQSVISALKAIFGIILSILTALTDVSVRSGVMGVIVGILVISNIWTLVSLRGARDGTSNKYALGSGYEGTNGADWTGRARPRSVVRHTGSGPEFGQSIKSPVGRSAQIQEQAQLGSESSDSVAEAVRLFLEDYLPPAYHQPRPRTYHHAHSASRQQQFPALSSLEEIEELKGSLDDIERWLERLRESATHIAVASGVEDGITSNSGCDLADQTS